MIVNIISESEYFPGKDQGVHTAYSNQAQMLRDKGIDVLINSSRKADIVHIHTLGPLGLYKLRSNKKTVVTAHIIPNSFIGSLVGTKYWLPAFSTYIRYFYNHASLVLAVAPQVKKELEDLGVTSRIEIFPNAINTDRFKKDGSLRNQCRNLLKIDKDKFVLIGVGQVQERKGIADFIELAMQFSKYLFLWIGGEPFKNLMAQDEKLKKLLHYQPENFRLISNINYKDMPSYYNAADVFFFPSYQENASMAIVEAAACSLPLLLRDIPEYRKLYVKGYLVARDNDGFAKAIKKLATDKSYYASCSRDSQKLSEKFSFEALGDKLIGYYKSVL